MKIEAIEARTKQLDKPALISIDKALGTIKEHFPEIYNRCDFVLWQQINTIELSKVS